MNTTAVNADEYPVGDGGPGGVLGATVIAHFVSRDTPQFFKDLHYICLGWTGSHCGLFI